MERAFLTHKVRESREIKGPWKFWVDNENYASKKVVTPSCWEMYPGYENYRGVGNYETELELEGNTRFCFKGISHTADIYLDDIKIAHHYNAYTPFDVVIQNVVKGAHQLKIVVDNSYNDESALHIINDYFTYGGINRPVIVEKVDDMWIKAMHFTPYRKNGHWHAKIEARIENLSGETTKKIRLRLEEEELLFETITLAHGTNSFVRELDFGSVDCYEPGKPRLYQLCGELLANDAEETVIDDLYDRVGFREIKIEGSNVLWNEKPIKVKGFNRHEEHALFGAAIPYEAMDYDLQLIIESGANAVRTSHYPNDERFLDLCDEYGLLVWEESHARGLEEHQMRHKNFRQQSLDCIYEMIDHHYNHPCIFTWGILNECASDTEYGKEIYIEQINKIRELDNSRPVTFASNHYKTDICFDLPDIVSMNLYPLWYFDTDPKEHLKEVLEWVATTMGKGKPYIVSEIGAGAIPGYRDARNPKWSEERQNSIIGAQLEAVMTNEAIQGIFIWQFCDGRVPDENFYGRPRCMNNKGIVDEYRRKKKAFENVERYFHNYY